MQVESILSQAGKRRDQETSKDHGDRKRHTGTGCTLSWQARGDGNTGECAGRPDTASENLLSTAYTVQNFHSEENRKTSKHGIMSRSQMTSPKGNSGKINLISTVT